MEDGRRRGGRGVPARPSPSSPYFSLQPALASEPPDTRRAIGSGDGESRPDANGTTGESDALDPELLELGDTASSCSCSSSSTLCE